MSDKQFAETEFGEGTRILRYTIDGKPRHGYIEEVYPALDTDLDRKVVLQFLPSRFAADPEIKARFTRAARIAAAVNHPNLAHIYEVAEYENRPFVAMEFLGDRTLRDLLREGGLSGRHAIDIGVQICAGLRAWHDAKLVHLDLRPGQIAVSKALQVQLLPMGHILRECGAVEAISDADASRPHYISPEQAAGGEPDFFGNIFTVGIILCEMFSGKHPFKGPTASETRQAIADAKLPQLRDQSGITAELRLIIEKALGKTPSSRYQRIDYLQSDLASARTINSLRESEEQYRSVVEQANDGICIIQNRLLKFINRRLAGMVGYTVEEGLNTAFVDYLHPDEMPRVVEKYNLMITGEEDAQRYETVLVHRQGETVAVEINSVLIKHEGHRAILAIVRDISRRKKAEQSLRESEEKFSRLFQYSNDAIFIHDLEGRILDVNQRAVQLFGYSREELLTLSIPDLHPPSALEQSQAAFKKVMQDHFTNFEIDFKKAGGEIFPAEVSAGITEIGGRKIIQGIVRDISERKQAESALQESRRALSTLMDNLPGMAYRCRNDRDWTMEFASNGCVALTGYDTADLINNKRISYNDIIHPDDREMVWNDVQPAVDQKKHFQLIYRIITSDKREKWVWEQGCGVYDENGELEALEGFIIDITGQKQTEQHLQLLSSIVKQSSEGMALSDLEGNIQYVNNAFAEMHGYSPEELLHKNLSTCHSPAQLPEVNTANQILRETGKFSGEVWHQRRNGSVFPAHMNNSLLYDDSGQPIGMIGIMLDITEVKRAEMELRESEEKYRNLVNLSPDPVIIVQDGKYLLINPAFTDLFGFTQNDVDEGLTFDRLLRDEDREAIQSRYERRLAGKTLPKAFNIMLVTKGGEEIACETTGTMIQYGGKPAELVIIRDVTERKKAEEALRTAHERLNATLNALPDLLFEVDTEGRIHDFRAPNPEMLYRPPSEFLGEKVKDCLPPPAAEIIMEAVLETAEKGHCSDITYSLEIEGRSYWFELSGAARGNPDDPDRRITFLVRDITDRRRAEEALREGEERYRLLIENAGTTITLFDRDGRLLLINSSGARLLGGRPHDFIGKTMQDILPNRAELLLERNREVIETGEGMSVEDMMELPGGNRWFSSNLQLLKNADGEIMGVQIISHDITDRKLAEMELERTTRIIQQERNMFISGPVVVCKWQNLPGWPMEYVSPNVEQVLGYSVDELTSGEVAYADLIPAEDLPRVADEVTAYSESGVEDFSHEPYRIRRKDGDIIWIADFTTILRNTAGQITHYLGYIVDVTERKLAEDMLRRRTDQLNTERKELKNKNIALNQILEHIENQKQDHLQQIYRDLEKALAPLLKKLKEKSGLKMTREFASLENQFNAILTKDMDDFTQRYSKLTSRESEICDLLKKGMSSKQIAESLNLSLLTIMKHREQIRRKLGLTNKSINLATYLRSH